jgi:hypothetical protein
MRPANVSFNFLKCVVTLCSHLKKRRWILSNHHEKYQLNITCNIGILLTRQPMNSMERYGINLTPRSYSVSIKWSKILAAEFMHRQTATIYTILYYPSQHKNYQDLTDVTSVKWVYWWYNLLHVSDHRAILRQYTLIIISQIYYNTMTTSKTRDSYKVDTLFKLAPFL